MLRFIFLFVFSVILIQQNKVLGQTQDPEDMMAISERCYQSGNNDSALLFLSLITDSSSFTEALQTKARAFNLQGNIYEEQGNFSQAYISYYSAIRLFLSIGKKDGLANAVNNAANIFYRRAQYQDALKYQKFALRLRREIKDTSGIASSYNNLGNIYYSWNKYENALQYYNKAIDLKKQINDNSEVINIRLNIGSAWLGMKNYELARFHYSEAMRLADDEKNEVLKTDAMINLGYAEMLSNNFNAAILLFQQALASARTNNLKMEEVLSLKNMAELYIKTDKYSEASNSLTQASELGKKMGLTETVLDISQLEIQLLVKQKQYKEAWEKQQVYNEEYNNLYDEAAMQQLYDFQSIQKFEGQQKELKIKNLELSLREKEVSSLQRLIIISVSALLILLIALFFIFRLRQKRNDLLSQSKQFAAMQKALAAQMNPHFISNSLNSIQSFFLKNDISSASDYLNRFGFLIRKVLDMSAKESVTWEEEMEVLKLYVEIESLRLNRKILLHINAVSEFSDLDFRLPPLLLQPVIENAIWHGIAHHEKEGKIEIHAETFENNMICTITDNGVGIAGCTEAEKGKPYRKSYGVNLVRERIQMMSASASSECFQISDITNTAGTISGCMVKLVIPLHYV
ncbi:MAG: hypothetical protein CVU05_13380 [Bacteroidetes bacterium HGW-Bacteroidetes-21]|jgi:tetratricopeptide (TPR) repeat protein/anti-sigma regulatory factor (Ser/Thr protein kinase)|nr:MAG: hypothetical protein CVU05_13380 [Bacteroidetes bacterium HGW-Bacteroidetes-21]